MQCHKTGESVIVRLCTTVGSVATGQPSLTPKRYLAYLASFSRAATLRQVFDFLCTRLRLRPEDSRLWQLNDEVRPSPALDATNPAGRATLAYLLRR